MLLDPALVEPLLERVDAELAVAPEPEPPLETVEMEVLDPLVEVLPTLDPETEVMLEEASEAEVLEDAVEVPEPAEEPPELLVEWLLPVTVLIEVVLLEVVPVDAGLVVLPEEPELLLEAP